MGIAYDITFHPKWWHKNVGIDFSKDFFYNPEYRMDCDLKMQKALYDRFGKYGMGEKNPIKRPLLGTDYLAAGYLHSQIIGCDVIFQKDDSPQVICMNLDEDTVGDLSEPCLDKNPVWLELQKQINYLLEHYGRVETNINLMGIQNIAMDVMGQELLISYYTAPEEVERLLQKITNLSIAIGKRFNALSSHVSGGVTAIVRKVMPNCYLTSNCSVEMISNALYEEFLLKYDQQLSDTFASFGIHHCGQTMEHVMEGYKKVKGLVFAEVGAFSDIQTIRKSLPNLHLNARYSPVRLMEATLDEIYNEVHALITLGKVDSMNSNTHPGLASVTGEMNQQKNSPGIYKRISVSCVGIDDQVDDRKIEKFLEICSELT